MHPTLLPLLAAMLLAAGAHLPAPEPTTPFNHRGYLHADLPDRIGLASERRRRHHHDTIPQHFERDTARAEARDHHRDDSAASQESMLEERVARHRGDRGGEGSPELADALFAAGIHYAEHDRYGRGDTLLAEWAALSLRLRDTVDRSTLAHRLSMVGDLRARRGDLAGAIPLLQEALRLQEELHPGRAHLDLAKARLALGWALQGHGDFEESRPLFDSALLECRNLYRKGGRPGLAEAYRGAARARRAMRDNGKVGSFFWESLKMNRNRHGNGPSVEVAISLADRAMAHCDRGEYEEAQEKIEMAIATYDGVITSSAVDPDYARILCDAARYYRERGDLRSAADYAERSLAIRTSLYPNIDHYDVAMSRAELSAIRTAQGDTTAARLELSRALEMLQRLYDGRSHYELAALTEAMGELYADRGDYEAAAPFIDEAAQMYDELRGWRDHPGLAANLANLGRILAWKGKFERADSAFADAFAMERRLHAGKNALELALHIFAIARYADDFGLMDRATIAYEELLDLLPKVARESSMFEGEEQQIRLQERLGPAAGAIASFYMRNGMAKDLFNFALRSKGRVLSAIEWRNRVLMELGMSSPRLVELIEEYRNKGFYRSEKRFALDSVDEDGKQMRERMKRLEWRLTCMSADLLKQYTRPSWLTVQRALGRHDAIVEYLRVPTGDEDGLGDSVRYCALVLRRNDTAPTIVPLCGERELRRILKHAVGESESFSYIHNAMRREDLYESIWAPFDSLLDSAGTIYISADGLLNRVALGTLYKENRRMLLESYQLHYLFSANDLLKDQPIVPTLRSASRSAAVFGGENYNADSATMAEAMARRGQRRVNVSDGVAVENSRGMPPPGDSLIPLPNTRNEAEKAAEILRGRGYDVGLYLDADASEEAFIALTSPTVLHVATHGYFTADTSLADTAIDWSEGALLRSGLYFSGANNILRGRPPIQGVRDGIVTAYDVAHMNLSRTELVVLSACQTGLGDLRSGEGVFGLKRAFRAAGARTVMLSLWNVPDRKTAELMKLFYRNWLERGMGKAAALIEAQREMAKTDDAYDWGAFMLVGE